MSLPLILGIVGERNSGKSIVYRYMKSKQGVFAARNSDILSSILRTLTLDPNDRENNIAPLAEALRRTFGPGVIPLAQLKEGLRSRKPIIVLEGMRRVQEVRILKKYRNFRLLFISAPAALRWRWARVRNLRKDDAVSLARFKAIERTLVTEREIPRIGRLANVRIDNIGTRKELFRKVDAALRQLLKA